MADFRLSIITVVYNAESLLPVTLDSVRAVKNESVEYVVVDGASKDKSLEIVRSYDLADQIKSEPDKGIYDAMNKGLEMATGEYVVFINAGDEILPEAVNRILDPATTADVLYGDAMFVDQDRNELGLRSVYTTRPLPENLTRKSFQMGQAVCHQSFVVRLQLAPSYNLKYKISSDYDWMLTCIKRSATRANLGTPVSRFLHGGVSKQQLKTALRERFWIMVNNFGWSTTVYNHIKILVRGLSFYSKNKRLD